MAKVGIQLHMLLEEVIETVRRWILQFNLHGVLVGHVGLPIIRIDSQNIGEEIISRRDYDHLVLSVYPFSNTNIAGNRILDYYPNSLSFRIGRLEGGGLRQSFISAVTDDSPSLKIWKMIEKNIRSSTLSGVECFDPQSHHLSYSKSFRYTKGALEAESRGLVMLGIVGNMPHRLSGRDRKSNDL